MDLQQLTEYRDHLKEKEDLRTQFQQLMAMELMRSFVPTYKPQQSPQSSVGMRHHGGGYVD